MENENDVVDKSASLPARDELTKKDYLISGSILISTIILATIWLFINGPTTEKPLHNKSATAENRVLSALEEKVLPSEGVKLPVVWGDLGAKLVSVGVIDANKFKEIYQSRNEFSKEYEDLLLGSENGKLKITAENSGYLLNLLWALGLANKNPILDDGEISSPSYGGAGKFASTGGWTISVGDPMNHFSMHRFFTLTPEQQALVGKMAKGIYRPCCGNSTHFPDCNHGMAMLGLLELMASQGVSEREMWRTALIVNSYWFPDNYLTIASYMESKGIDWNDLDPKEVLSYEYSSGPGYVNIYSKVSVSESRQGGGGGCGLDSYVSSARQQRSQVGCSI